MLKYQPRPDGFVLEGTHNGFDALPGKPRHIRRFHVRPEAIVIHDRIEGAADRPARIGFLLHPGAEILACGQGAALRCGSAILKLSASLPFGIEPAVWWPDMGVEQVTSRMVLQLPPQTEAVRTEIRISSCDRRGIGRMKQVVQNYRTGELKVAEVPAPALPDGNLLVATRASLISAGTEKQLTDLAKASLAGKAIARPDLVRRVLRNIKRDGLRPTMEKVFAKLDTPVPLGYSVAGEVLRVGRSVQGFAVGDRVACAGAGLANHAEINAVPKNLTVPVPDGVDDEEASFVTLGAIALQGVRQAEPTLGERFVVMGLGLIGLLTVQLLKANGCRVLGFDPKPERAALARELGADMAVNIGLAEAVQGFTGGHGADAVILTASAKSSEPVNLAAEISRLKGRIVLVGMTGMTIDREPFYKREITLKLSLSYGPGRARSQLRIVRARLSAALCALDRAAEYGGVPRARG